MKTNTLKLSFCTLIASAVLIFTLTSLNKGYAFTPTNKAAVEKQETSDKKKRGW